MKKLYVFRGLPGSGKSTLAAKVAALVVEPDMFRYNSEHEYVFDSDKNDEVHRRAELLLLFAMNLEMPCLAIAATHVKPDHFWRYVSMGHDHGYEVTVVECYGQYGSIHSVPDRTMRKMEAEFEPMTEQEAERWGVKLERHGMPKEMK